MPAWAALFRAAQIVYGATGLVGRWCLQMLADMGGAAGAGHGRKLLLPGESGAPKWAIAGTPVYLQASVVSTILNSAHTHIGMYRHVGRSSERLLPLAKKFGVEAFVADGNDDGAFDAITAATSVVVAVGRPDNRAYSPFSRAN